MTFIMCQVVPIVTKEMQAHIAKLLKFSKAKMGVVCTGDVSTEPPIRKWDRLEPSLELPDCHLFKQQDLPFNATFWRGKAKTLRIIHESPILKIPGVTTDT